MSALRPRLYCPPLRRWMGACLPALLVTPAWADTCSFTQSGIALGATSSFSVKNGPQPNSLGAATMTCGTGLQLSLLTADSKVTANIRSANNLSLVRVSPTTPAASIGYTLTGKVNNNAATTLNVTTTGVPVVNLTGSVAILALLLSGRTVNIALTAQTLAANVPSGTYRDTLSIDWNYNLCQVAALGGCLGTQYLGTQTQTIVVELTVNNDCLITPGAINFGSAILPSQFAEAASQMSLVCTTGTTFTIGLGPGGYAAGGRRQMSNTTTPTSSDRLAYDIFYGASTTPWGTLTGTRVSSTQATAGPASGLTDGVNAHVFPYRARIYPTQTPVVPGTYKDTVTVDVQF